jgi:hypothetical protein
MRVLLREYANPIPALSRLNSFLIDAQRLDGRDKDALVCVALALVNTETGAAAITSAGMEPPWWFAKTAAWKRSRSMA